MQFLIENPVLFIVGPTASGKTALAVDLAIQLNAEVISADSRYFYRGMDIGTAKPTLAERKGVPHHLIDVADPDVTISLGEFRQNVLRLIEAIHKRNKWVILVGGSGQYIHSILEGWSIPEVKPDSRMRAILENWCNEIGARALHEKLSIIDAAAAEKIDYHNVRRTIRAFEVIFHVGHRFSEQGKKYLNLPFHYKIIGLNLNRNDLFKKIDTRIQIMLELGLVNETKKLIEQYGENLPSMSAIGYREIAAFLKGETDLQAAVTLMKKRTHAFVRRQANWFKDADPKIQWYFSDTYQLDVVMNYVNSPLGWK